MTETLENLLAEALTEAKPQTTLISDPAQIEKIIARGKWREHLPHWERLGTSVVLYK